MPTKRNMLPKSTLIPDGPQALRQNALDVPRPRRCGLILKSSLMGGLEDRLRQMAADQCRRESAPVRSQRRDARAFKRERTRSAFGFPKEKPKNGLQSATVMGKQYPI
jgi:hypothetical protein